jgi:hypothetical protein
MAQTPDQIPDDYNEFRRQGGYTVPGPDLASFRPAKRNLRSSKRRYIQSGVVRTKANVRPTRGYLLKLARKSKGKRGYLRTLGKNRPRPKEPGT